MTPQKPSGLPIRSNQHGVSLLLALIFVAFFGGILVSLVRFGATEIRQSEARVVGWELVEIGKAARLYARDHWSLDPNYKTFVSTPKRVTVATLKAEGYLPASFGRNNGTDDLTALNQRIYVILANWSSAGLGGAVTDSTTIPSAFVYLQNGGKSASRLMIDTVDNARRFGASISAPLFDFGNVNRSADCRGGGAAVGLWDTGCMTAGEFQTIATALGLPGVFSAGALIMPAWKAVQPDMRAVMRFPQPENPGFATMLTDLQMGTPVGDCTQAANQINITTLDAAGNTTSVSSGTCKTLDDTAALNRRYNIDRVGNIFAQRLIAEPQTTDYTNAGLGIPVETASMGTANDEAMNVTGNVTASSDVRVFPVRPLPAGVAYRMDIPQGSLTIERNMYLSTQNLSRHSTANIGTLTAAGLYTDELTAPSFTATASTARVNVTTRTSIAGNLDFNNAATSELVASRVNAPNATLRASDNSGQVQVTGTLALNAATLNVTNTTPSAALQGHTAVFGETSGTGNVTASTDLQFMAGNASLNADHTQDNNGNAMDRVDTARCLEDNTVANACPERQFTPPFITP